tara:strand:+ start:540 stop:713 length:174 start_codon:yes stop_codon:yes gene_type:complete
MELNMPEFKVTIITGHKKIYYVKAEDWEKAEDIASKGLIEPDEEEFLKEEIDSEEWD